MAPVESSLVGDSRTRAAPPSSSPEAETVISPSPLLDARKGPRTTAEHQATPSATFAAAELATEVERARADAARRFGPFVILTEIGKGGMGVVHRAWNDRLRRVVALKTILVADPDSVLRFHREAEAAGRLRHPCIVSIHEAGELEGKHYIAMDYVEGGTLERRLEAKDGRRRIPLTRALEVIRDVARAVQYAHEQGVVHRDLKPANILLDARDHPFVLDFGVASIRGSGTKLTRTGAAVGTPAYMPPEQASGEQADERSDVYALGATLYHVLSGRPPFAGSADVNLIVAVLTKDPVPPGAFNRRASGDLETITLKCLEKDPARRYASAGELADDLDRYLAGEAIAARPLGALARLGRRARRNKPAAALATLAVLLVGALGAGGALAFRDRALAQSKAAEEKESAARSARDAIVERARADAVSAGKKLEAERASRRPAGSEGAEARQARLRPLVALAIESREAAGRLASLVEKDPAALEGAFLANMALGEVALEAEQWELAASAFARAASLGSDDARASRALEDVSKRRSALLGEHRRVVEATIASVDSESYDHEETLFTLVRLGEPQTVTLLCRELDATTRVLKQATRTVLLRAERPTPEEAAAGAETIEGLAAAVETVLALPPGARADDRTRELVARAHERIVDREGRKRHSSRVAIAPITSIIASAQLERLGHARVELTRLACEALGRIGRKEEALPSLAAYLWVEADSERAALAAIALCELHDDEAEELVRSAPQMGSLSFKMRIRRVLQKSARPVSHEARSPSDHVKKGDLLYDRGDSEGAVAEYTLAIELSPDDAHAWNARGSVLVFRREFVRAAADFTRAIELAPDHAAYWTNRGNAQWRAKNVDAAIADYSHAIELAPKYASAWAGRGNARQVKKDHDGAIADFTHAIALDASFGKAWDGRAGSRIEKGDLDGALADATRALEIDERDGFAWDLRGLARERRGELDGALADYTRAIDLAPHAAGYWRDRGVLFLFKKNEPDKAIADLARTIELDPLDGRAFYYRGRARSALHDLEGAFADLSRAVELDPKSAAVSLVVRGGVRSRNRDSKGAIEDYSKAIEADPKYGPAWASRGAMRDREGDVDGALSDLTRAIELDPKDEFGWIHRSRVLRKKKDVDGALADAARAVEVAPASSEAWSALGEAKFRKGDVDGAIADLTHAISLDAHGARPYRYRGECRAKKGDHESALADYGRAIELLPTDPSSWRARGLSRQKLGDREGAIADFERFLELAPDDAYAPATRAALEKLRGK